MKHKVTHISLFSRLQWWWHLFSLVIVLTHPLFTSSTCSDCVFSGHCNRQWLIYDCWFRDVCLHNAGLVTFWKPHDFMLASHSLQMKCLIVSLNCNNNTLLMKYIILVLASLLFRMLSPGGWIFAQFHVFMGWNNINHNYIGINTMSQTTGSDPGMRRFCLSGGITVWDRSSLCWYSFSDNPPI